MKIGLPGALFLVLLVLKLTGHIATSWVWVTAPLWGGVAIWLAFMLFCLTMAGIVAWLDDRGSRRR